MGQPAWRSVSLEPSTSRSVCLRCLSSRGRCGGRSTSWSALTPSLAPRHPASVISHPHIISLLFLFAVPSKISDFMEHKAQFIVAHPCNPPYHTPMVELVPAPWTSTEVCVSEPDCIFSFFIFLFLRYVLELEPLWLRLGKAPSASQGRCLGLS